MSFRRGQLRYFVTVADEGQITRAARKLHLAQPSLSQAITQLEAEVGFKLLQRHTHGVTLTPAGQKFYGTGDMETVAGRVGCPSEAVFSVALKRGAGASPSRYLRAMLRSEMREPPNAYKLPD